MYWLILFQQLLASTTHIAARGAVMHGDPLFVVLMRAVFSSAIFLVFLFFQRKNLPAFDRTDTMRFFWLGLVNVPINQVLFMTGLRFTIAPNAALAYAITPAFVLIISVVFFSEHVTKQKFIGIVIAFAGVLLVLFEKGMNLTSDYVIGNVLELLAAFTWALYSVLGRSMSIKYGALYSVTIGMVSGTILYVPLYFLFRYILISVPENGWSPLQIITQATASVITPELWLEIVYLAVVATCASFFLWFYAMKTVEASKVAVFMNLQPVIATVLTILIWGTVPTPIFFVGGAVVIIGVILTQRK